MMGALRKPMNEDWITTLEAAELSGYDPEHVRRLARAGKIDAKKWGQEWMISKVSILKYRQDEGRKPKKKQKA